MTSGTPNLASRLIEARTASGYGQEFVAKAVRMSQQSYSDLETGKSKSTSKIGSLAHVLGVNALWLETGEGQRSQDRVGEIRAQYLPEDARRLLDWFNTLSPKRRRAVMELLSLD